MKSQFAALAVLAIVASASAHDSDQNLRRHADMAKRQSVASPPASSPAPSSPAAAPPASSSGAAPPPSSPPAGAPPASSPAPAGPSVSGAPGAIPLSQISSGMPSQSTLPVASTFAPGSKPTNIPGAPGLPNPPFQFVQGQWPTMDVVVDPTSAQVQEWMKELDGWNIPDIPPTVDGTCANSPTNTANAAQYGWWSCGGHTRPTDILACPDKMTWGVSFDDGPGPYTQTLLNYLGQNDLSATFFVVGSRVIEYPDLLREEYMTGHEISVHTWSHHPLTSLTTEQIVGELGWTRAAIKAVLGVTPTTMRPPFGDIDDRVRAISLAMGMVPIIWTSAPQSGPFDTNDWKVPGGVVTAPQSFATFQGILGNASTLDTGFIVLQHDLFQQTVDLATGYTLPAAMSHQPPFTLKSIGECMKIPNQNLYLESNTNKSFPYPNSTAVTNSSAGGNSAQDGSAAPAMLGAPLSGFLAAVGLLTALTVL